MAVVGRSPEKTRAVAQRIGGQPHPVDYGQLDDVRRLAGELLAAYGRIDILANNAGAIFTARRTDGTGITASAFHPGVVRTDIGRDSRVFRVMNSSLGRFVLPAAERGAEPLLHLAALADPQLLNGTYFSRLRPEEPANEQARDPALARALWDRSAQLTGV